LVIDGASTGARSRRLHLHHHVHLPPRTRSSPRKPLADRCRSTGHRSAPSSGSSSNGKGRCARTTLVVGGVYGPTSPISTGASAPSWPARVGMYAPDSGLGVVDVRTWPSSSAGHGTGRGPRRYLVSGRYVTWEDWAACWPRHRTPVPYTGHPEDMISWAEVRRAPRLGPGPAALSKSGHRDVVGRPGDDTATCRLRCHLPPRSRPSGTPSTGSGTPAVGTDG